MNRYRIRHSRQSLNDFINDNHVFTFRFRGQLHRATCHASCFVSFENNDLPENVKCEVDQAIYELVRKREASWILPSGAQEIVDRYCAEEFLSWSMTREVLAVCSTCNYKNYVIYEIAHKNWSITRLKNAHDLIDITCGLNGQNYKIGDFTIYRCPTCGRQLFWKAVEIWSVQRIEMCLGVKRWESVVFLKWSIVV